MTEVIRPCPVCGADLELAQKNGLPIFQCPAGDGVGINLLEANGQLQRDEIQAIWSAVNTAPFSSLKSPINGNQMLEVTFTVDDDVDFRNEGSNSRQMTIAVDAENHFGWFSFDELKSLPSDPQPNSEPGLVDMGQITDGENFNETVIDDLAISEPQKASGLGGLFGGLAKKLRS